MKSQRVTFAFMEDVDEEGKAVWGSKFQDLNPAMLDKALKDINMYGNTEGIIQFAMLAELQYQRELIRETNQVLNSIFLIIGKMIDTEELDIGPQKTT